MWVSEPDPAGRVVDAGQPLAAARPEGRFSPQRHLSVWQVLAAPAVDGVRAGRGQVSVV
ncbi:hypothetical protein AB0B50_44030 [Streptomyces sp. NPDC041068]|uniref:hypothetical protein n=1 Tax=Streptomyces sp. NPDC041068 TaxID=3155130 RepID=UPI0033D9F49A